MPEVDNEASAIDPQSAPSAPDADTYYYDRAEVELERAINADHPDAVRAHYLLAGMYLDRFYSGSGVGGDQPTPVVEDHAIRVRQHVR